MSDTDDVTTPGTSWHKVAQYIAETIRSGEVAEGEKIASYRQLTEDCHAALGTVKRAIEYFQRIGVLRGYPGAGVFVVRKPTDEELDFFSTVTTGEIVERLEGVEKSVADLRADHAGVRAQLVELYSLLGRPYPSS